MSERERFLADKSPGSEWHLTMLMAPYHLNFFVGQDRQHLLAWGRDVWNAARSGQAASGSQENARSDVQNGVGQPEAPTAAPLEPVAHMFPSDLEKFKTNETWAQAFSVAVGSPDERTVPLYAHPPARSGAGSEEGQG